MSTKNDFVEQSYEEIRISGLTVSPTPSDDQLALTRLEDFMQELFYNKNMDVGYVFEDTPDLNTESGVPRNFRSMIAQNLAIRLIPAFNKQVPQTLFELAQGSMSAAMAYVKSRTLQPTQISNRMPKGSGNTFRNIYLNRFFVPEPLPPETSETNTIYVGETYDYFEDFSAWLAGNTISSYTIAVDPRLTLDTSANADPRITYTITANSTDSSTIWQYVKITVTDSAGRVQIRLINFAVYKPPTVP